MTHPIDDMIRGAARAGYEPSAEDAEAAANDAAVAGMKQQLDAFAFDQTMRGRYDVMTVDDSDDDSNYTEVTEQELDGRIADNWLRRDRPVSATDAAARVFGFPTEAEAGEALAAMQADGHDVDPASSLAEAMREQEAEER
jgi:hypothetical protein